jgi:hypothetical protein
MILPTVQTLKNNNVEFVLDQKQLLLDRYNNIHSSNWMAQSFQPSISPLTKIMLKIQKPVVITEPLKLSIRKTLNGSELIYLPISSDDIPYFNYWVEIDIPDIEVEIGQTYYIVLRTDSPAGKSYRWYYKYNQTGDPYDKGKVMISNNFGLEWELIENEGQFADATFQTYSYISKPNLECEGYLNWTDIIPGSIVNGTITINNIGTPLSHLNWEISNWPSWGEWSFSPNQGNDLLPEDGTKTIQITVKAPNSQIPEEYNGEILIVNKDNTTDYSIIKSVLITPDKIQKDDFLFTKIIPAFLKYLIFFIN